MTNPLDEYLEEKTANRSARKQHELDLWARWKEGGQQAEHLEPLLKLYEPVIAQKVRAWKPPMVPASVFKAELQSHAISAFESFDPSRGVALNTHVETRLPKAMRYGNRNANLAYIPEGQSRHIGVLQAAQNTLREDLGRDPTHQEISDYVRGLSPKNKELTPKRVGTILTAVRRDIPMGRSAGEESFDYGSGENTARGFEDQQIAVAQHILPDIFPNKPEMHTLFNHVFGTNGHEQITSTAALAKKLGKSQSQVSRMKTVMGDTLRKHMGLDDE